MCPITPFHTLLLPLEEGDYVLLSDRVRFPPNSSLSDPISVKLVDDFEVENYETFSLHLLISVAAHSCGARYGGIRKLDVLIHDDDGVCRLRTVFYFIL